ncbi:MULTISPECIES: IclR family transcriptional regulator [unclassified Crossiella]|uniref:IclR family transcriptional regulator n=1 Tax=unclassified Crossiella TaxID=2620835 RepID=UPI001FFF2BB5|nr:MULTISPECIES: IclR family transcriptional regulator [unclassified Crossiella]MCK2237688.1 IclR family transcriptional regulator [Crossiella sp. S99.2]MCK2254974.1 IclR family transcriptional regulator [Crossiella sp. S99.1]
MTEGPGGAVEKALAVLDALAEHSRVTDLARATGLPKSTVHRVLQTLAEQGFALPDAHGNYLAGPKVLALAGRVLQRLDPARRARPALTGLQAGTGCAVHFAMLFGAELVYVDKVEADKPYRMASRIGMGLPLHSSAIGKAVLAALPEIELSALLGKLRLEARTPRTASTPAVLRERLTGARSAGFAVDDEENEPGVRCVAAAVRDHTGAVIGGVSVSALVLEHRLAELTGHGPRVVRAAREVSTAFGWSTAL